MKSAFVTAIVLLSFQVSALEIKCNGNDLRSGKKVALTVRFKSYPKSPLTMELVSGSRRVQVPVQSCFFGEAEVDCREASPTGEKDYVVLTYQKKTQVNGVTQTEELMTILEAPATAPNGSVMYLSDTNNEHVTIQAALEKCSVKP